MSSGAKNPSGLAGLKYADYGSFDYGRELWRSLRCGSLHRYAAEWGGDSWPVTDNFMTGRTNGVATYRNTDFFGMVEGLISLQYQGKNHDDDYAKANGDGYSMSVD